MPDDLEKSLVDQNAAYSEVFMAMRSVRKAVGLDPFHHPESRAADVGCAVDEAGADLE